MKSYEWFIYRGHLEKSQIDGYGEFKWPDGRHYIGDFVNSQMHGIGKMTWFSKDTQGNQIKNTYNLGLATTNKKIKPLLDSSP